MSADPQSAEPVAFRWYTDKHWWFTESEERAIGRRQHGFTVEPLYSESALLAQRQAREAAERMSAAHREHAQTAVEHSASVNRLLSIAEARTEAAEASLAKAEARIAELEAAFLDIAHFTPDAATGVDRFEQITRHARATTLAVLSSINKGPFHG